MHSRKNKSCVILGLVLGLLKVTQISNATSVWNGGIGDVRQMLWSIYKLVAQWNLYWNVKQFLSGSVGGAPNYFPNSFSAADTQPCFIESKCQVSPDVGRYNSADDDNVTQVCWPSCASVCGLSSHPWVLIFLSAGAHVLHRGAERSRARASVSEYGRPYERSSTVYSETRGMILISSKLFKLLISSYWGTWLGKKQHDSR